MIWHSIFSFQPRPARSASSLFFRWAKPRPIRFSVRCAGRKRKVRQCVRVAVAAKAMRFQAAANSSAGGVAINSRHKRNDLRQPQDGLYRSARRNRHFRERREGRLCAPSQPRPRLPIQDRLILSHKLREAMAAEQAVALEGDVEMDGGYFGGTLILKTGKRTAATAA